MFMMMACPRAQRADGWILWDMSLVIPLLPKCSMAERSGCGRAQEASERLLQETAEAASARLSFAGVQDVRLAVDAAAAGRSLHPLHLTAVAGTLEAAAALERHIAGGGRAERSVLGCSLVASACNVAEAAGIRLPSVSGVHHNRHMFGLCIGL